jgi:hypothetical protein
MRVKLKIYIYRQKSIQRPFHGESSTYLHQFTVYTGVQASDANIGLKSEVSINIEFPKESFNVYKQGFRETSDGNTWLKLSLECARLD